MVQRASDEVKRYRLGVLLVHGIGMQPAGDTLMRWGDALVGTLRAGGQERLEVEVERAAVEPSGGEDQVAEAVLRLRPVGGEPEHWLLSEGWWADAFLSPGYSDLVSWSIRALPWSFGMHIAQKYWEARERSGGRVPWGAAILAGAQLLVALAVAPLFVVLLGLALILGLLPIPRLREAIVAVQGVLTATVGDSLAFVESPVRAALIRTRVLDALGRLNARCDRTMIVAHSQGAAVVLDALGGIVTGNAAQAVFPDRAGPAPLLPDTLLTFGAGTNKLASLKVLDRGLPARIGVNPASYAMATILVCAGIAAWVYAGVAMRETSLADVLGAVAILIAATGFFSFAVWLTMKHIVPFLAQRSGIVERDRSKAATWLITGLFLLTLIPLFVYAERTGLPLTSVAIFASAAILLLGSLVTMLSRELRAAVTSARTPPGLGRWIDIYASHDPVPNGPTWTATDDPVESHRISNRGSILSDHTTYWENSDEFTLRVARACARTAGSSWGSLLPEDTATIGARAAWRLGWLRLARGAATIGWGVSGLIIWSDVRETMPLPFPLPAWLPAAAMIGARTAVLIVGLAVLAAATSAILTGIWRMWVRREQKLLLLHRPSVAKEEMVLTAIGFVVWFVLSFLYTLSRDGTMQTLETLRDPTAVLSGLPAILGASLLSAYLLSWLRPPPTDAGSADVIDSETAGGPGRPARSP